MIKTHQTMILWYEAALNDPRPIPVPLLPEDQEGIPVFDPRFPVTLPRELLEEIIDLNNPGLQQKALRACLQTKLQGEREVLAELEESVGAAGEDGLLDHSDDDVDELPGNVVLAARHNEVQTVLDWLGSDDPTTVVPYKQIYANYPSFMYRTLLHEAAYNLNVGLMRLLPQKGACVDPRSATV